MKIDEIKLGQRLIKLAKDLNLEVTDKVAIVISEFTKELLMGDFVKKKVKKIEVIKHNYLGRIDLDEEEFLEFEEDKEGWLSDCDMPSFSYDKGSIAEAEEGDEFFIRLNDDLYSFTISEGECIEASWSGSIYSTDVSNIKLIPKEDEGNYNLTKLGSYGYDFSN